jgi:hypothetical protein
MNEPLHPLTLSEILDRTAQLYRSRFLLFLGIATLPAGTLFLFAAGIFGFIAWIGVNSRHGATVADISVWVFLIVLLILVVPGSLITSALGEAAMSDAAARFFLGETTTIRIAYKTAWKLGGRYVGLFVLQGLAIFAGPAVLFVIAVTIMVAAKVSGYANNDPSPLFGGLVLLLIVVIGAVVVWVLLRLCLAFPASVIEQTTAWNALKRGTYLSSGTRGRMFVLYLLGLFLNQILAWAVTIPALIVIALIPGLQGQAHAQTLGTIMIFVAYGSGFAVRALTKPVYGIALTLFYFDQRIRKEGFDIEWMMMRAGMVPVPAPTAVTVPASSGTVDPQESVIASVVANEPSSVLEILEPVTMPPTVLSDRPEEGKA